MKINIDDEIVKKANETFRKHYDWDGTIENWEEWIQDLTEETIYRDY